MPQAVAGIRGVGVGAVLPCWSGRPREIPTAPPPTCGPWWSWPGAALPRERFPCPMGGRPGEFTGTCSSPAFLLSLCPARAGPGCPRSAGAAEGLRPPGGTASSGQVNIVKDLSESIEGRDVLVVEDILDSGNKTGSRQSAGKSLCRVYLHDSSNGGHVLSR